MPRRSRTKPKAGWQALGFFDTGFQALVAERRRAGTERARAKLIAGGVLETTLAQIETSAAITKNDVAPAVPGCAPPR
jgi:hypothetical protein